MRRKSPYCRILACLSAFFVFASYACAQEAPCPDSVDPTSEPAFATVRDTVTRSHFLAQSDVSPQCPADEPACRLASFLIPGDQVIVTDYRPNSTACVVYISAKGQTTAAAMATSALLITNAYPSLDDSGIVGTWKLGETATLEFKESEGLLLVRGDATRGPPSYNMGEIAGLVTTSGITEAGGYTTDQYAGDKAPTAITEPDDTACRVRFRNTGYYLFVDDNDRCGGFGVSFSGIYVKSDNPTK